MSWCVLLHAPRGKAVRQEFKILVSHSHVLAFNLQDSDWAGLHKISIRADPLRQLKVDTSNTHVLVNRDAAEQ